MDIFVEKEATIAQRLAKDLEKFKLLELEELERGSSFEEELFYIIEKYKMNEKADVSSTVLRLYLSNCLETLNAMKQSQMSMLWK